VVISLEPDARRHRKKFRAYAGARRCCVLEPRRECSLAQARFGVLRSPGVRASRPGAVQNRENEREEENRENEVFCTTGDRERAIAVYFRGKTVQSVDTLSNNPLNGILSVSQCLRMA
jgi:hypothetical protein